MRRLTTMLREVRWSDRARRLARWQNPLVASPGAPFETVAALDALGPSLMPRTPRLAGMANAMAVPGEFGSFGHDYRADMVRFVQDAYQLPAASEQQLARIEQTLVSLELDRAERIKAQRAHLAPPAPAHRDAGMDAVAGVPLRTPTHPRRPLAQAAPRRGPAPVTTAEPRVPADRAITPSE